LRFLEISFFSPPYYRASSWVCQVPCVGSLTVPKCPGECWVWLQEPERSLEAPGSPLKAVGVGKRSKILRGA